MTILTILGIVLLLLIVYIGILFLCFPQQLIHFINSKYVKAAKIKRRVININSYDIHYFISRNLSHNETLVLLHGMGDDKNSFLQVCKALSSNYNLILPDLKGHGENIKNMDLNYSIEEQTTFLHVLLTKIGISKCNLVGVSMGGHISALYALKHPKIVKKLILINSAGIELENYQIYTDFGPEVYTKEKFDEMFSKLYYIPPKIPLPFKKYMINETNKKRNFIDNILLPSIRRGKYFDLKPHIKGIMMPTLILRGEYDNIIPYEVAEIFRKSIANSEFQIVKKIAHAPQLEAPDFIAQTIHSFITKQN